MQICETKEEARLRFAVCLRNALEGKDEYKQNKGYEVCTGCCSEGGSSGSMQCVRKEDGCELNPMRNLWLLGTWVMLRIARKFDESGTGFFVQSV